MESFISHPQKRKTSDNLLVITRLSRAENETRTRDPNLGKVVLYQLSYFRNYVGNSSVLLVLNCECKDSEKK